MAKQNQQQHKVTMEEVMDELQSRFLMNLPPSEFSSTERLFFQIEQCYWFYEDFYADVVSHLPHMKLHEFARRMFNHCILLKPIRAQYESLLEDFRVYQSEIPVVGCILLNSTCTKVLLVRNWKGTSWTFPRGKINQGESDEDGAKRESLEECGYDVSQKFLPNAYFETKNAQQRVRLYIIPGVSEKFAFAPQTRKEISLIQFFPLDALPKKTWAVLPFMTRLKRWISRGGPATAATITSVEPSSKSKKGKKKKGGNTSTTTTPKTPRSSSAPKNRQGGGKKKQGGVKVLKNPDRSVSTPHLRPKVTRGHFGSEKNTKTSNDALNDVTFGETGASSNKESFSVDEMFAINEKLTGQKFVYDGNSRDFGNSTPAKGRREEDKHAALAAPVAALFRSAEQNASCRTPPHSQPPLQSSIQGSGGSLLEPPVLKLAPPTAPPKLRSKEQHLGNDSNNDLKPKTILESSNSTATDNDDDGNLTDSGTFEFDTTDIMNVL